mgnify:CR=1 FL=1
MNLTQHLLSLYSSIVPTWLEKQSRLSNEHEMMLMYAGFAAMRAPLVGISHYLPNEDPAQDG